MAVDSDTLGAALALTKAIPGTAANTAITAAESAITAASVAAAHNYGIAENNHTLVIDEPEESSGETEAIVVDSMLSITGAAADAKVTGDELSSVKSALVKDVPITALMTVGRGINASGAITTSASYNIWFFPVIAGRTYKFTTSDSVCYYAWFTDAPYAGDQAYDNTRYTGDSLSVELKAPITGYLVFRSDAATETVYTYLSCAADYDAEDAIAVLETVFNEFNVPVTMIVGRGINSSGTITTSSSYNMWYCKVSEGAKYKLTTQDSAYYYAWFADVPLAGASAYNGTRYVATSATIEVTSPINGYLAFRSAASFENASVSTVTAIDVRARDEINLLMGARDTVYVSTSGNDSNDGTASAPYRTIAKAITSGALRIMVASGTYNETFSEYYVRQYIELIGNNVTVNCTQLQFRNAIVLIEGITFVCNTATEQASNLFLRQCEGIVRDCVAKDATYMGFRLDGSKIELVNCLADSSAVDGFNAHDTSSNVSECTFVNCKAINCGDDGLSFHENGIIHVLGGEYAGCTSTGIAPHNNCNCDIRGAYIHHNGRAGIEAFFGSASETTETPPTMILSGCTFEANVGNAVTARYYIVKASANGASGNGTNAIVNDGGSTITTFALMQ